MVKKFKDPSTGVQYKTIELISEYAGTTNGELFTYRNVMAYLRQRTGVEYNVTAVKKCLMLLTSREELGCKVSHSSYEPFQYSTNVDAVGQPITFKEPVLVCIPLSAQSDLWNTMFVFCAPCEHQEHNHLTLADVYRWNDIVVSVWNARSASQPQGQFGSSLVSSSFVEKNYRGGFARE